MCEVHDLGFKKSYKNFSIQFVIVNNWSFVNPQVNIDKYLKGMYYTIVKFPLIITSVIAVLTILAVSSPIQNVYGPIYMEYEGIKGEVSSKAIPTWVDQVFKWYGAGEISQTELINSIKYLLEHNIMSIGDEITVILYPAPGNNFTPGDEITVIIRPAAGFIPQASDEILVSFLQGSDPENMYIGTTSSTDSESAYSKYMITGATHTASNTWADFRDPSWYTEEINDLVEKNTMEPRTWSSKFSEIKNNLKVIIPNGSSQTEHEVGHWHGLFVHYNIQNEMLHQYTQIDNQLDFLIGYLKTIPVGSSSSRYALSTGDNLVIDKVSELERKRQSLDIGLKILGDELSKLGLTIESDNETLQYKIQYLMSQYNQAENTQQSITMLSNIMKTKHDTAKSIIQDLRA